MSKPKFSENLGDVAALGDYGACRRGEEFKAQRVAQSPEVSHVKKRHEVGADGRELGSMVAKQVDVIDVEEKDSNARAFKKVV
jgi:hypothetical protein